MKVTKDKVVSIHYTLKDDNGTVIDSSEGRDALTYLHGNGNLVPGLEKDIEGKEVGAKFKSVVSPAEGYGEVDPQMVIELPKENFEGVDDIQPGMQFQAQWEDGVQLFTVVEVKDNTVVVDGNHALAGQTLNFDIEVTDIRDASKEEIEHGHVHDPNHHHHH
jgi:FKBP-type peptidyl-prolyl cis-trans isomerase SlyD